MYLVNGNRDGDVSLAFGRRQEGATLNIPNAMTGISYPELSFIVGAAIVLRETQRREGVGEFAGEGNEL